MHCVVPAGGLSADGQRWIASDPRFFLPVRVLSRVFRGKFIALLKRARQAEQLRFPGRLASLAPATQFEELLDQAVRQDWVVYSKPPFGGTVQLLKYLARYTQRVALANSRLVAFDGKKVRFRWKDYADGGRHKTMTLAADEFTRRFLLHVLPGGFTRIRYFGFLANRHRAAKLAAIRQLLGTPAVATESESTVPQASPKETAEVGQRCPVCRSGQFLPVAVILPHVPRAWHWLLRRTGGLSRPPSGTPP
ncbi:MAG TPA: transposase [Pirellulales bacterium]|nr:transposase [Pirellulales bacterium]